MGAKEEAKLGGGGDGVVPVVVPDGGGDPVVLVDGSGAGAVEFAALTSMSNFCPFWQWSPIVQMKKWSPSFVRLTTTGLVLDTLETFAQLS